MRRVSTGPLCPRWGITLDRFVGSRDAAGLASRPKAKKSLFLSLFRDHLGCCRANDECQIDYFSKTPRSSSRDSNHNHGVCGIFDPSRHHAASIASRLVEEIVREAAKEC